MRWTRRPRYDPDEDNGAVAETLRRLRATGLMEIGLTAVNEEQRDGIGTEYVAIEHVVDLMPQQVALITEALDGLDYELRQVSRDHRVFYGP
jgi:hypothetical protein